MLFLSHVATLEYYHVVEHSTYTSTKAGWAARFLIINYYFLVSYNLCLVIIIIIYNLALY